MGQFIISHWRSLIEGLLLGVVIFTVWRYLSRNSGSRLLAHVLVTILTLLLAAHMLGLELVRTFAFFLGMILVVIFQPEVRRAFVSLGSHRFFSGARENLQLVEALEEAVRDLSSKRFGALFAFERGMELEQFLETGVEIDGKFTPELIMTIFHPKTALHDGGMILRQGRIVGAGCVFPVSQREVQDRSIGLRHRAAMGISEQTDAIAVIVSEETGHISLCAGGELEQMLTPEQLHDRLVRLLKVKDGLDTAHARDSTSLGERSVSKRVEV